MTEEEILNAIYDLTELTQDLSIDWVGSADESDFTTTGVDGFEVTIRRVDDVYSIELRTDGELAGRTDSVPGGSRVGTEAAGALYALFHLAKNVATSATSAAWAGAVAKARQTRKP